MSTSDGKVYGWGDGTYRQILPTATTTIYSSPTEIVSTTNPAQVAAGFNYSLLVDPGAAGAGGTVKAWGQNTRFQAHPSTAGSGTNCALGTGTTCLFSAMQDVTVAGTNVIDISAAYYHSLALRADGALRVWGDNSLSQLGTGSATQLDPAVDNGYGTGRITAVTLPTGEAALSLHAALYHSLIRTATGKLVGWGTNSIYGVLGNGTTTVVSAPAYTATAITATSPIISVDTFGVGTTAGSTGVPTSQYANQTVAVDASGQVWAWGSNVFGQVGANITQAKTGTNRQARD
jgi:alpha-tubulin suppressor-like RCC1 family protein